MWAAAGRTMSSPSSARTSGSMARADARLIVQVVVNIVDNALKYTPPGSHIDITAAREDDKVAVTIADDGPGVPPEVGERVFEMFFSGSNAPCTDCP